MLPVSFFVIIITEDLEMKVAICLCTDQLMKQYHSTTVLRRSQNFILQNKPYY